MRVVFPAGWSFRGRHNSGLYGYIPNGLRHGNFFGGFSGSLERAATYLFVWPLRRLSTIWCAILDDPEYMDDDAGIVRDVRESCGVTFVNDAEGQKGMIVPSNWFDKLQERVRRVRHQGFNFDVDVFQRGICSWACFLQVSKGDGSQMRRTCPRHVWTQGPKGAWIMGLCWSSSLHGACTQPQVGAGWSWVELDGAGSGDFISVALVMLVMKLKSCETSSAWVRIIQNERSQPSQPSQPVLTTTVYHLAVCSCWCKAKRILVSEAGANRANWVAEPRLVHRRATSKSKWKAATLATWKPHKATRCHEVVDDGYYQVSMNSVLKKSVFGRQDLYYL